MVASILFAPAVRECVCERRIGLNSCQVNTNTHSHTLTYVIGLIFLPYETCSKGGNETLIIQITIDYLIVL